MPKSKRKFTAEFKTRIALDALSGDHTLSELAGKHGVHPNQISRWKQQVKEQIAAGFAGKTRKTRKSDEVRIKELHAKIGQLTMEKDFFRASLRQNLSCERRRKIVDTDHPVLSVRRQCEVLNLQCSSTPPTCPKSDIVHETVHLNFAVG